LATIALFLPFQPGAELFGLDILGKQAKIVLRRFVTGAQEERE
jgi:hypothetical protein